MINHPSITHQIASERRRDLLAAAAHHRFAREAFAERPFDRLPALSARPPQVSCACR